MTSHSFSRNPVHNVLTTVMLVAAAILIFGGGNNVVEADETIPYFVLPAKTMGKRSGTFEDFFLKASKSVPRIGRRSYAPAFLKSAEPSSGYPRLPTDLSKAGGDDLWSSEKFAPELEQSPEFWKMIAAEAAAEAPTASGYNNEVWQREKRTGSEPAAV